jgi:light-regulated signal transduction histidine kinase (bacteriophytochrome)
VCSSDLRLLDSKHAQLENANDLLDQKNNQLQTTNDQLAQKNVALLAANHALDRSNEDLQLAMTKLTEKNTELTEFTYIASHDLQEPVRKMISFGQLLREDAGNNLPQIAQEDLSRIVDAANRMNCLIQDLLRLSRTGAAAMRNENVPIRCCIDDALDLLSETIAERSAEIECCEYFPTVTGDSTMLTQVFQNLISNALKFTKAEQPRIEITAEQDGDSWILGVRDNGIGISQENAETIFKPFKRLHSRDEYSGTGIGLSICKKAVNRHGGEIWIESGENGGTHFKFKLQETQTAEASGPLSLQEC